MTLLDLADEITTGVRRLAQREQILRRIVELKRVDSNLNGLTAVVAEAVSLVGAAYECGLTISVDRLAALRARMTDGALHDDEGGLDVPACEQLVVDVRSEAASVKSAVTDLWYELVDRKILQRQGLRLLAEAVLRLDSHNVAAMQLRQAVDAAEGLARESPSTEALLRLDQLASQIPQLTWDLVGDSPSVRAFVERAARGGASLDSLTPEVERWIDSEGFERFFKITIGEPEA